MSARSVNSNLITMLKFNLTEIDVTFQCNISRAKLAVHIIDTLIHVFIRKIVNLYFKSIISISRVSHDNLICKNMWNTFGFRRETVSFISVTICNFRSQ